MKKWRIEDSEELYNIKGWGVNYFGINEAGHVYVTPKKMEHGEVAVGSLGLPTVARQHYVLGTLAKSDESQPVCLHLHGVWDSLSWLRLPDSLVVRIIYPIYRGSDVNLCPEGIRATAIVSKLQCVNY